MEKWIEIKSLPEVFFAHNYVSASNYTNHLIAQNDFFELSYLRFENKGLTAEKAFKDQREFGVESARLDDGCVCFHLRPYAEDVSYEGLFEVHCVGVRCKNKCFFPERSLKISSSAKNAERLKQIIDEIIKLYNFYPEKKIRISALVLEYVDLFFSQYEKDAIEGKEVTGEIGYVNKAKGYIKKFIDKKITVKAIADYAHVSEAYLCTVFKKITGETLVTYINKYRLYLIKMYITEYGMTLKEACAKVGVIDPAYASRLFRKHEKQSLREFKATEWKDPRKKGKKKEK